MPRGNRSGVPHAKNQPPRPKIVAPKAMEFLGYELKKFGMSNLKKKKRRLIKLYGRGPLCQKSAYSTNCFLAKNIKK